MKNYYTTYAMHCLRLYLRIPRDELTNDVHRLNWDAAERAYISLNVFQQSVINYCFTRSEKPTDQLAIEYARQQGVDLGTIQKVIANTCKKVAIERGLI